MLKQPLPSRRRTLVGTAFVAVLASLAGVAAWAGQPPTVSATTQKPASAVPSSDVLTPPKYPAGAIAQQISGRVVLLIDIDQRGNPTAIEVERAEPVGVFEAAAQSAAWSWKFSPAIENGRPVASRIRVPVVFEADGTPPDDQGDASPGAMAVTQR